MARVILASGSPRRKELMGLLNIPFEIISADIDETIDTEKPVAEEIERLSFEKALAVFKDNRDAVVIGSDTVVAIKNEILGKPGNDENAREMLKKLSGNVHEVITAVTILSLEKSETFSSVAKVYFNELSDEEIEEYISTGEPLDKAGAYAIQGNAGKFINRIDGDYFTIVGFPIAQVYSRIKAYL